nr:MAG TPA: hypothetical protein [Caudoviricetes sp.]
MLCVYQCMRVCTHVSQPQVYKSLGHDETDMPHRDTPIQVSHQVQVLGTGTQDNLLACVTSYKCITNVLVTITVSQTRSLLNSERVYKLLASLARLRRRCLHNDAVRRASAVSNGCHRLPP